MNIQLKAMTLINFKGISNLIIDFNPVTDILGENATGKTTVFDAFLWLLFGKDSTDRKDFEIKTLDSKNRPMHKLDHEVMAVLDVDGSEIVIRRVYREKWTKQRGKSESEMTGHETEYYWNDVPMQQKEYHGKISGLVDETLFKLITNTAYFNSLNWQERRKVLESIAGNISDTEVAEGDTDFEKLLKDISGKTFAEYKTLQSARKKKLKDQIEQIPTRIQEAKRAFPEEIEYSVFEKALTAKQAELLTVETGIENEAQAARDNNKLVAEKINKVHGWHTEINQITFDLQKEINTARQNRELFIQQKKSDLRTLQDETSSRANQLNRIKGEIESLENQATALRTEWHKENSRVFEFTDEFTFDENESICPTCKQHLPADTIDNRRTTLQKNFDDSKAAKEKTFNSAKTTRLNDINTNGSNIKIKIIDLKTKLAELGTTDDDQNKIAALTNSIAQLEQTHSLLNDSEASQISTAIATNEKINELKTKMATIQVEIDHMDKPSTKLTTELKEKKTAITAEIDVLKKQLATKDLRKQQEERIEELDRQEKEFAQQISDIEAIEFTILRFEKAKMDELETRVNSMFKYVKFKMFETQINGGEVPTCLTLIDGVPYADANNAARINAGLDIIRVLQEYHKVQAPVFIDNAESVIKLLPIDAQVIRLVVFPGAKKLRVQSAMEAVA
jgi:DNA repair exonuclease SbcCD ATPase subunit